MLKAGNVGGELLNWIAMLGAIGNRKPTLCGAADAERPRLRRVAVELTASNQNIG